MGNGISASGTTITLDAASVGTVVSFSAPAEETKEFDVSGVADTIEIFKASPVQIAPEFTFTLNLEPDDYALALRDSGSFVVTWQKKDAGSTTASTWTFTGFVKSIGAVDGDKAGDSALQQQVTIRLTSTISKVAEA